MTPNRVRCERVCGGIELEREDGSLESKHGADKSNGRRRDDEAEEEKLPVAHGMSFGLEDRRPHDTRLRERA